MPRAQVPGPCLSPGATEGASIAHEPTVGHDAILRAVVNKG